MAQLESRADVNDINVIEERSSPLSHETSETIMAQLESKDGVDDTDGFEEKEFLSHRDAFETPEQPPLTSVKESQGDDTTSSPSASTSLTPIPFSRSSNGLNDSCGSSEDQIAKDMKQGTFSEPVLKKAVRSGNAQGSGLNSNEGAIDQKIESNSLLIETLCPEPKTVPAEVRLSVIDKPENSNMRNVNGGNDHDLMNEIETYEADHLTTAPKIADEKEIDQPFSSSPVHAPLSPEQVQVESLILSELNNVLVKLGFGVRKSDESYGNGPLLQDDSNDNTEKSSHEEICDYSVSPNLQEFVTGLQYQLSK